MTLLLGLSLTATASNVELKKSSFEEIKKAIENQNAYSEIFYLNETYGLKIWNKQTEKKYTIELPLDTLTISVVFIENYALKGLADFITIGSAQDGGWSSISKNKLFCHKGEYDLDSEKFKISYLKHEANHFVDGLKYPNLSSADMEYRSKLIEFIYVKSEAQNLVASFINSASNENRNNAHAYANYTIIKHLSEKIFDKEYETDISKWGNIEVK
ncbi:MAG: hypothetical protein HRT73_06810 [Flavobacteriales bacterium]|nr:hypothetical protein [Flavobacteriales bacterium]